MIEEILNIDNIRLLDVPDSNEFGTLMPDESLTESGDLLAGSIFSTDSIGSTNSVFQSFQLANPIESLKGSHGLSDYEISFGNNIDSIYDPLIQSAHDDVSYHHHAADNAQSYNDWELHRHKETDAANSEEYWIESKYEALTDHQKTEIKNKYQEFLNEQYSISHVENMYNDIYGNNHEVSFGSSEHPLTTGDASAQISFQGYQEEARDAAASRLQSKLSDNHIYYPGTLSSSDTWGGWDRYTGEKIRQAIQEARNSGKISDSKYSELMRDLKNACYYE